MSLLATAATDHFNEQDERYAASIARWVASVAHRAELVEEIGRNSVEQGRRAMADELVTILAHDLRNFVNPISGRLQILRRRAAQDQRDPDVRDCEAAMSAVERLGRLNTDILDVARIDQGVFRLEIAPVDLAALSADVAKTLSTPFNEVHVASSGEVIIAADAGRVAQCIENLVSNAIRHSPRGASVTLLVTKKIVEGGELGVLEVRDEGPGVPIDIIPRIFERFYRGQGSPGIGLGLYLAKRLAAAHGGDLKVQSEPGKGARFCLEIPVYVD